jgi:Not1 N-terminal domain, CCR4-Not complex component
MGAARKLQQEIDATLKKVREGISAFDDIIDKVRLPSSVACDPSQLLLQPARQQRGVLRVRPFFTVTSAVVAGKC